MKRIHSDPNNRKKIKKKYIKFIDFPLPTPERITNNDIPFYIKHLDPLHEQTIIGFYVTDGKHYQHFSQTFIVPCERIEKGNTFGKEYQRKLDHYKKELTLALEEWEKHSEYLTEIVYDKYVMVHDYKKPKNYKIVSEIPK